jgi:UDP-N-acetylmuramoylalanine--D-glutamate ligase
VAEALKTGGRVTTSVGLFAKLAAEKGAKLIGVTGTRGKSTTTELIYEMIKASGQPVHLGGNVRGLSTLSLLPKIKLGDWVVLELDSWQLQGFGAEKLSPQIAVFTNFMDDHLNYYAGDRQQYFADKANIYKWQRPGDHLIVGSKLKIPDCAGVRAKAADVPAGWKLKLLGEHNRENLALAIIAAELAGVKPAVIKKVAQTFPGMPGRLEWRRTWRGIKIYNDTTSTTPDALEAGLKAMGQKAILIMGGADKNLPLEVLAARLPGLTKKVFMLPGTGTDKFKVQLTKAKKFAEVQSLKEGFQKALAEAKKGDVILFSPGFASFGLFKNEFDRGDQFNDLVAALP